MLHKSSLASCFFVLLSSKPATKSSSRVSVYLYGQTPWRAHIYDRKHLTSWVSETGENNNTCPICRHALFEKESDNSGDTLILSSYDGLHERFEFNRRDERKEESRLSF